MPTSKRLSSLRTNSITPLNVRKMGTKKNGDRQLFPRKVACPLVPPECEAAEETGDVGDDLDVAGQFHGDAFGVASADVQEIVVEHEIQGADCSHQALVPFFLPDFFEHGIAQQLFVGFALLKRMVPEFQVRD